jgi:hypothetical protein
LRAVGGTVQCAPASPERSLPLEEAAVPAMSSPASGGLAASLELAAAQLGLLTHAQLRGLGFSNDSIRRRVRSGLFVVRHPGIYAVASQLPDFRQRVLAACLWAGPSALGCRRSAAALWGLGRVRASKPEVLVPHGTSPRRDRGVAVHETRLLLPGDAQRLGPVPVTSVARTLIDLAGTNLPDYRLAEALDDAVCRELVGLEALHRRFAAIARPGRPGVGRLRPLLEERLELGSHKKADLEGRVLELILEAGLPMPAREVPVEHPEGKIFVDFGWPERRLGVECDSAKHHKGATQLVWSDRRQNELLLGGWFLLRFTWASTTVERSVSRRQLERAWAMREWMALGRTHTPHTHRR